MAENQIMMNYEETLEKIHSFNVFGSRLGAANIALDLLFVAGFRWGVLGAALATDIAQAGSLAAAWFYMTRKYAVFSFGRKDFTWDFSLAKKTLATGLPIASQLIIVSVG